MRSLICGDYRPLTLNTTGRPSAVVTVPANPFRAMLAEHPIFRLAHEGDLGAGEIGHLDERCYLPATGI